MIVFQPVPLLLAIVVWAYATLPAFGQKKPETKDQPPQVIIAMPMAVDAGKTTKLILRGLGIDTVTEIRLHEPKSTGKIIGKAKKVPVPANTDPKQIGDSEIDVEVTLPTEIASATVPFSLIGPGGQSKPHELIVKDGSTIVLEKEPNDGFKQAQPIAFPCVIEGSIRQPQDVDVFRFEGKQGDKLVFDVQANRFGSPLDGFLTLFDEAGATVASADDSPHSIDPILHVTLPRTGVYYLSLIDAHDHGGAIYLYRLVARRP